MFFNKNFINISLKNIKNIKKVKKYNLIVKITILNIKNYFLFINFKNSDFILYIN